VALAEAVMAALKAALRQAELQIPVVVVAADREIPQVMAAVRGEPAVLASSVFVIRWRLRHEEACRWDEGCEACRFVRTLERDGPFRAA
jgi:hypothetical protein